MVMQQINDEVTCASFIHIRFLIEFKGRAKLTLLTVMHNHVLFKLPCY